MSTKNASPYIYAHYDFYTPHSRVTLDFDEINPQSISLTKQSHKNECDINTILKQYSKTGIISHINTQSPQYLELPDALDYQESLNVVAEASIAFDSLPSVVRDHFKNDPLNFLSSFSDPSQRETLEKFGLLKARPPVGDPPVSPSPAPASEGPTKGASGAVKT